MSQTVFFSWQSDVPAKYGKAFIEEALREAIAQITQSADLEEANRPEIELDKDTNGKGGNISIIDTIHEKIEKCSVFVADMTFVGRTDKKFISGGSDRKIPNPNVLIEYGYAVAKLGYERTILIANKAYLDAKLEDLPFDMRHLRGPIYYDLSDHNNGEGITERKKNRQKELENLSNSLFDAIKKIFDNEKLSPPQRKNIKLNNNGDLDWNENDIWKVKNDNDVPVKFNFSPINSTISFLIYGENLCYKEIKNIYIDPILLNKRTRKIISEFGDGFVTFNNDNYYAEFPRSALSLIFHSYYGHFFLRHSYNYETEPNQQYFAVEFEIPKYLLDKVNEMIEKLKSTRKIKKINFQIHMNGLRKFQITQNGRAYSFKEDYFYYDGTISISESAFDLYNEIYSDIKIKLLNES